MTVPSVVPSGRMRADPTALRLDLPDFVEFMLGVRIGEA
jgi:hypothetical protein